MKNETKPNKKKAAIKLYDIAPKKDAKGGQAGSLAAKKMPAGPNTDKCRKAGGGSSVDF
jgi:hypothetical protein